MKTGKLKKVIGFLSSMRFGLILLVLICICSVPGSLISQGESVSYYASRFPEHHGLLLKLQLDHVFTSWYFIALLSVLCVNLLLCTVMRIRRIADSDRKLLEKAAGMPDMVAVTPEGVKKLETELISMHCTKMTVGDARVYTRSGFGRYGTLIVHISILLVVILGACALYTPKVIDESCFPGESLVMEDGTEIYVDSFSILNEQGELDYASNIRVTLPNGKTSGLRSISVNHPLSIGSYKIYQQTYGTAGSVTVINHLTGGEDTFTLDDVCFLSIDSVNGIWFEALYPGYIRDEDGNFTLITSTSGRYEDPVYQVLVAGDGQYSPVLAFPGESLTLGDIEFIFNDPVEYPGLRMKITPVIVSVLLCVSFALLVAGLGITFFLQPVTVKVDGAGYTVTGTHPEGTALELRMLLEKSDYAEAAGSAGNAESMENSGSIERAENNDSTGNTGNTGKTGNTESAGNTGSASADSEPGTRMP